LNEEGKETNQSILDYTPHPDVISAGANQAFKTPEYDIHLLALPF
jgi:hypothetical protein